MELAKTCLGRVVVLEGGQEPAQEGEMIGNGIFRAASDLYMCEDIKKEVNLSSVRQLLLPRNTSQRNGHRSVDPFCLCRRERYTGAHLQVVAEWNHKWIGIN